MIRIELTGGLGNNMFEYASAKSLAKKKKYKFFYVPQRNFKFYLKQLKKILVFLFLGKKDLFKKQLSKKDLSTYFKLEESFIKLIFYNFIWNIKKEKYKKKYKYKKLFNESINSDSIREDFYSVSDWTDLDGGFCSEKYFIDRDSILKWFTPNNYYQKKIDNIEKDFYLEKDMRCCVHIRRGDALFMDKGCAYKNLGWSVPKEYYDFIFNKLGTDLLYIFVSDDPEWALDKFNYLPNKIFLKDNPEVVDMFIFSLCKYNVLSRGTFSWWGAWLNQTFNKVVYAPKYFLGIPKKRCIPYGMDKGEELKQWNFIEIIENQ